MTGIERIAAERKRQIEVEGYTQGSDAEHRGGELAQAGAAYAFPPRVRGIDSGFRFDILFPEWWDDKWWKPSPENRIRELEKAGALIAAEIDRLQDIPDE